EGHHRGDPSTKSVSLKADVPDQLGQLQGAIVLLQRLIVPAEVMQCDPHPDGRARRLRQVPASLRNPEALYFELEAALGVAPTSLERPAGEEASRQGPRLGAVGREVDRLVHTGRGLGEIP